MNLEKYNDATILLKDIATTKNTINNLCKFLNKDKTIDVKLKTPQDNCLEYPFNQDELNYVISYLLQIHDSKLENLEEKFNNLQENIK